MLHFEAFPLKICHTSERKDEQEKRPLHPWAGMCCGKWLLPASPSARLGLWTNLGSVEFSLLVEGTKLFSSFHFLS